MIINVPVYLEVEGHFSPQEGKELAMILRKLLNDFIRKESGGHFFLNSDQGQKTVKVLSEQQAINRFGVNQSLAVSPVFGLKSPPTKGKTLGTDFNTHGV